MIKILKVNDSNQELRNGRTFSDKKILYYFSLSLLKIVFTYKNYVLDKVHKVKKPYELFNSIFIIKKWIFNLSSNSNEKFNFMQMT